jgi:hypothetical protein
MNPSLAFEAAKDVTESLGPAGNPLLFAVAAALVLATALLLLLGGRANRRTGVLLRRSDGLVSSRDGGTGGPDA